MRRSPARLLLLPALALCACAAALEPGDDDGGAGGSEPDALMGNAHAGGHVAPPTGGSQGGGGQFVPPPVPDAGPVGPPPTPDANVPAGEFSAVSRQLCQVVNDYRVSVGLPAVALSAALMRVAKAHVADLSAHPEGTQPPCNLHSWSNAGPWSPCCYTEDHAQAQCMWDKPRQIGGGAYQGDGFEIAAFGEITPAQALQLWQTSAPHHEVILNGGIWRDLSPWPGMGCGLQGNYAVVWFGSLPDPESP